jgi:hypothetical protein
MPRALGRVEKVAQDGPRPLPWWLSITTKAVSGCPVGS